MGEQIPDRSYRRPLGKPEFLRDEPPSGYVSRDRPARGIDVPGPTSADALRERAEMGEWDINIWRQEMIDKGWMNDASGRALQEQPSKDTTISRRRFLALGGAAVAAGALGQLDYSHGYTTLGRFLNDKISGQYDYDTAVREAKKFLRENYSISLIMGEDADRKQIHGDRIALEKYRTSLKLLLTELTRYPPDMIKNAPALGGRPMEIRILENLKYRDSPKEAPRTLAGVLTGISRYPRMALSVSQTETYQRQTIHHEIYHLFQRPDQVGHKKKWTDMHARLSLGRTPYRPLPQGVDPLGRAREEYFVTNYAGTNALDDGAVTAEHMLTPSLHVLFLDQIRATRNPVAKRILTAKYFAIKKEYGEWSQGRMGEEFWENIRQHGIRERELIARAQ